MIKRDMVQADVYVQVTVLNEYNEKPKDFVFTKIIKMAIYPSKKEKTNDVRYIDEEYIGLSIDRTLDSTMRLQIKDSKYDVVKSNLSGRLAKYTLKKVR